MTPNMRETMQWLRTNGFMVKGQPMLTLDQKTEISDSFSSGNYCNAYETADLDAALDCVEFKPHERIAFVLGFFSSYSLAEIASDCRETFDECYHSEIGRYIVSEAGYCDDRSDEYTEENADFIGEESEI